jgi:hypothetical protein
MRLLPQSNSALTVGGVLPQYQAALTIVKDRLESPSIDRFRWLDLSCGRGQILIHARAVFGKSLRKIEYVGVEVDREFALQAQRSAEELFGAATVHICELHKFELQLKSDQYFDFISFANFAHEISPASLGLALTSALCRIDSNGQLCMYDMQSLPDLELGAITWSGSEMQSIINEILTGAGVFGYAPQAAEWPHESCRGWSIHVNRQYMSCSAETLNGGRKEMEARGAKIINLILQRKLIETDHSLNLLCRYGARTPEEQNEIARLTYDYWAISRALGGTAFLASETL